MRLALALDVGTTTTTAVAVDEAGTIQRVARRTHGADVPNLASGHAEQDPERHRQVALAVLRELAADLPGAPVCLGITGQMHGVTLVDAGRRPLTHHITWQDRRANQPSDDDGPSYLQQYLERCTESDLRGTGCRLAPGYLAVTWFVLQQQGELPAGVSQAVMLTDWLAAELCTGPVTTDRSNAAASGVYDLARDCWSEPLLQAGGLTRELLPDVVESGAVQGHLCPAVAQQAGLPVGLAVCSPVGDNQASVIGSVPAGETALQITIGTGGQINWPIEEFVRVPGMDTRYLPVGRSMLVGAGFVGGDAYAWVNRCVRSWLEPFGVSPAADDVYDVLNRLAATAPVHLDGLSCEPFFRGTRPEPHRRGMFAGVANDNFTLGHLARSVLQGMATAFHDVSLRAGDVRPAQVTRIIGCGNGLEQNPLLTQLLADTFGLEVWFPAHQEAAAYGAALLAGTQTGLWSDLSSAGAGIHHVRAAAPASSPSH